VPGILINGVVVYAGALNPAPPPPPRTVSDIFVPLTVVASPEIPPV
jgi:hypothetical protein